MSQSLDEYWPEKYRPTTLDECLIDDVLKDKIRAMVDSNKVPHMLLYGRPGISKTSLAKVIVNEMDADCLFISGSNEGRNIDTVRTTIIDFSMSMSLSNKPKVILIDEADFMNRESVQPALRTLMEVSSDNVRFILTGNEVMQIRDAIRSRCYEIDMEAHTVSKDVKLACMKRVVSILKAENVTYDKRSIVTFVDRVFPDIRQIMTRLQAASSNPDGIGPEILIDKSVAESPISMIREKRFTDMRAWATANYTRGVYTYLEHVIEKEVMDGNDLAQLILILADYAHKATRTMDQIVNLSACMFEISMRVRFK